MIDEKFLINDDDMNEYTHTIYGELFSECYNPSRMLERLKSGIYFRNFGEGLTKTIISMGYDKETDSVSHKTSWLIGKINESGGSIQRETVSDWFSGKRRPNCNAKGRKNMFLCCIAMKMTIAQTIKFFTTIFFDQPFNFRDPYECIYFFCLNHNLSWGDCMRLSDKYNEASKSVITSTIESNINTNIIKGRMPDLENEDELISYLTSNLPSEFKSYNTGYKLLEQLIDEAKECAQNEIENISSIRKDYVRYRNPESMDSLLYVIFDTYNKESLFKGENKTIPDAVKKNFPGKAVFSSVMKQKDSITADMMRKCIILLLFYISFSENYQEDETDMFDRFVSETNAILDECSMQLLYPANPYDWIFLSCITAGEEDISDTSMSFSPVLERFKGFISELAEGGYQEDDL